MFKVLRPIDLASLAIIAMGVSTGMTVSLGVNDPAAIIALTMGFTCPAARRLIAWRRGAEAIRMGRGTLSVGVVLCAMLPWMLLPVVHNLPWQEMSRLTTLGVQLPTAVRLGGVVLTIVGVLRPMLATLRGTGRIRSTAYLETVGLFLATGSAFLGAMAAAWLLVQVTSRGVASARIGSVAAAADPAAA